MKTPRALQPLVDNGLVDTVIRQLKSGKEASVFVVESGGRRLCAKIFKDAQHRGFQRLAEYQEGRKARGSRDARATGKRSRHGRRVQEEEWKNAEYAALYTLARAGVRVPQPQGVYDGVLLMELVVDAQGDPAPRLNDVDISAAQAREWHAFMIAQIVRMLCAGVIHGDLSEYNVLAAGCGPVIIDLPQAVDAASNNNALRMLRRDVDNMRACFGRAAPELLDTEYALEMWSLHQSGELTPDTRLSGRYVHVPGVADVDAVMAEIEDARREAEARQRGREALAME